MLFKWLKRIGYTIIGIFILMNIMAAFHAYKFTHFYSNLPPAKKSEQMSAGEKASAIFFGMNYPKSKVVDSLHPTHNTIKLTTNDGLQLESWWLQQDSAKGTIVMFHGHGSSKSGIIREAETFFAMGWNIFMTDLRAHGNSEGNICTIGANEAMDVKAAWDFIKEKGETKIVLYGISLGAATVMKSVNDFNLKPYKVILEMPFGTLMGAVEGRLRTMHLPEQPLSTLLAFWGGTEQGFWAFNLSPKTYAKKLNCPVLLQWGIHDQRVTETETNVIFNNLSTQNKTLVRYTNSTHESLCKKENEKWKQATNEFLSN